MKTRITKTQNGYDVDFDNGETIETIHLDGCIRIAREVAKLGPVAGREWAERKKFIRVIPNGAFAPGVANLLGIEDECPF